MLSDTELYSGHHKMQRHDMELFLESVVRKMDWSSQEHDVVTDIGCGPGKSTRETFLSTNTNNYTISKWSHQISKVVSIFCFQWLENQRAAFENIHHLLKPGGEAALVFILTSTNWDSYQLHYNNSKYRIYLENKRSYIPESHFKKYDAAFYQNLLKSIGFDVILCEEEKRSFSFPDDEMCRATLYSLCGLAKHIPEDLRAEFEEDTFENFLDNQPISFDTLRLNYTTLTVVIKKPSAWQEMLSDAELYSEHHKMQRRDMELFLESVVRKMDWSSQEHDVVMDIGCGPGKSTREMFLSTFPRVRKLIGVDVLEDMIEFAKINNAHEKMEYHVADIEDRDAISKWSQQISKVISIHCFNWLENQRRGFENVYHMLKPGGEAAVLFVLSTPFWDSYQLHYDNPKWSKYLKDKPSHIPESHFKKHGAAFYRNLLQDIGFKVIICEDEKRMFAYPNDDNCRNSISVCPLSTHIPDELKRDFQDEVMRGFLQYNGRNPNGEPVLHYTVLSVLVKKPAEVS